jgi:hypothetical protein
MAKGVKYSDASRTPATWMGDFASAHNLEPYGLMLDAALFPRQDAVTVVANGTSTAGTNEVQTVSLTGVPTGGTFTLSFGGQTTAPIAFDAIAATVQAALQALSTIGAGNATVTGTGPWIVTFAGALAKTNVALMTANGALLTGGTSPTAVVVETTAGVPAATAVAVVALTGEVPSGVVLDFGGGKVVTTTARALKGATSIPSTAVPVSIVNTNSAAYAGRTGEPKYVRAGTLVGRTYTERDAGAKWGPAVAADDEILILAFPIDDVTAKAEGTGWRRQRLVKENKLPDWDTIKADAPLLAKLRAAYQCVLGV